MKNKRLTRKISRSKFFARKYLSIFFLFIKIIFLLSIFIGLIYFFLFSDFFVIKKIFINGEEIFVNKNDVNTLIESGTKKKNLFLFNTERLKSDLKNNFLGAKDFVITKKLPDILEINIIERKPIAVVYKNENEDYFLVDDEGYVLGYVDPKTSVLPKIKYEKEIDIGKFIDKNLVPLYTELTMFLDLEDVKASSISFYPKYIHFYLEEGQQVLVGNEKNKLEAIKTVDALIKQSKLDNKEIRRIDLRYDKVIVLFK